MASKFKSKHKFAGKKVIVRNITDFDGEPLEAFVIDWWVNVYGKSFYTPKACNDMAYSFRARLKELPDDDQIVCAYVQGDYLLLHDSELEQEIPKPLAILEGSKIMKTDCQYDDLGSIESLQLWLDNGLYVNISMSGDSDMTELQVGMEYRAPIRRDIDGGKKST